jgi:thioredoxin 1
MSKEIQITDANFDSDVLKSSKPVLVDFWAPWCGPCKMIGPIIEEIAEEYSDLITVGKCNVDNNQEIALNYNVSSIPTLILFKSGTEINRMIGASTKERIVNFFKNYI